MTVAACVRVLFPSSSYVVKRIVKKQKPLKSVSFNILLNIKCMFVLAIIPTKLLFRCSTLYVWPALLHTQFVRIWDFVSVLVMKKSSSILLLHLQQTGFISLIYSIFINCWSIWWNFICWKTEIWHILLVMYLFKNATNTSTNPVLQVSCFTSITLKHHWNEDIFEFMLEPPNCSRFVHPVSAKLFMLRLRTVDHSSCVYLCCCNGEIIHKLRIHSLTLAAVVSLSKNAWRDVKGATNIQHNFSKQMSMWLN